MRTKILPILVVFAMFFASVPARAVLRTVVLQGAQGQPLANTTIVISDAAGNEIGEKDTDDKGVLIFDFPERGKEYQLKWDGGSQTVTTPRFSRRTKIGAGVALAGAATAGILLATGGADSPDRQHPDIGEIPGIYALTGNLASSTCAGYPSTLNNGGIGVTASGNFIKIESSADVTGPYDSASGQWRGEGLFTLGSTSTLEVYDGIWWLRNSHVEFEGDLSFTEAASQCTALYSGVRLDKL